ncbi:Superfamily II DNA or RNA helicase [Ruminococcaceae bacterium YAD3003]|nr:Superfamily II DNA or RNA helicase [Ruminococcaceae bacterium YAD3003]
MAKINPNNDIHTTAPIMPMIYAARIPYDIRWKDGWLKIGEARTQSVEKRLSQEGHEIDADLEPVWWDNALFVGTPIRFFRDTEFHKYLKNKKVECAKRRSSGNDMEVFKIDPDEAYRLFSEFRMNRGVVEHDFCVADYSLRKEQQDAVDMAFDYAQSHPGGEFLWNAKPRFGKTLATYDLAKRLGAKNVLIVTNRPAIANSWFDDYKQFIGRGSNGYFFVSGTDSLKDKSEVLSFSEYEDTVKARGKGFPLIYFVSLQDLKGSKYFSAEGLDKLREISTIKWDLLVVDEAHEGVDTYKTDIAFTQIKRKFTLHLSGTPFKALASEKFKNDAIFNWTYADEQKKKAEFAGRADNPYAELPKLNMFVYKISDMAADKLRKGIDLGDESGKYSFDLGEFFKTIEMSNGTVSFVENAAVDAFLDCLTTNEKYPFSTDKLRGELKHTLWLLDRIDSCKALQKKLENHPIFKDYKIIPAYGNGKVDESDPAVLNSFKAVKSAIEECENGTSGKRGTITLSVGQLTTGVTIPEWTAVLMLSNISSPAAYMQAAFRAQNPGTFISTEPNEAGEFEVRAKENAYVFDFDPARTLTVFDQFANNLNLGTINGGGTLEQRKANIHELLNFFPVIGEDEDGTLVELDVEQVLTIPRKIRSQEVVRRGFMSNFLFNISNVFSLPKPVMDVINKLEPTKEGKSGKKGADIVISASSGFVVDDDGNVTSTDEHTQDVVRDLFGDKKYSTVTVDDVSDLVESSSKQDKVDVLANQLASILETSAQSVVSDAKEQYGDDMRVSDNNQLNSHFKNKAAKTAQDLAADFKIKQNIMEKERDEAIEQIMDSIDTANLTETQVEAAIEEKQAEIDQEFEQKKSELKSEMTQQITDAVNLFTEESKTTTAKVMEEKKEQRRATDIMEDIRERLRGFSRTIPSFIMAYSKDDDGNPVEITLDSFDRIIDDDVFVEVTSITLEQFRQLRDGFDYTDESGERQHFNGNMFDQVVFDDSVAEFATLKDRLADYFDEDSYVLVDGQRVEDIFDLIPPQKTNQIYTPKKVVKEMVDFLEQENPGCFDNPDKTFIDPYMKSGLYITEIVKRLYRSEKMKEIYPDGVERLQHIFDKQVYGLAPTKIIYKISTSYILGFARLKGLNINTSHFVELNSLPYAQGLMDMSLKEKLDELFGKDD